MWTNGDSIDQLGLIRRCVNQHFVRGWVMDFVSRVLSLIGIGSDRATHISNRRTEVARLNAEVANEADQAVAILAYEIPRLTRRCSMLPAEQRSACEIILKSLAEQQDAAIQLKGMTNSNRENILKGGTFVDWDRALIMTQEWRITASRIAPWIENVVKRLDGALNDAGIPPY